jgi:transposase InsO family protein
MKKARTPWPVATRVQYVVGYEYVQKKWGLSARQFCRAAEVPYPTFARWWSAWRRSGKYGLLDRSRRPHGSPSALPVATIELVRRFHRELGVGVRRLHVQMAARGVACSLSSVYRILRRAGALVLRPRKPRPIWIRYAKAHPGERAQMDLKYLPRGLFQLTLIDDCSRYLAACVIPKRTMAAVATALPALLAELPFPLRCIQTDNGSEFGSALTLLLKELGIRHAHTRPRTPRLNGKVERVHRTMQEEFWDAVEDASPEHWKPWLRDYVRFYNRRRIHSALGYKTPAEYALERLPRQARLSHMS